MIFKLFLTILLFLWKLTNLYYNIPIWVISWFRTCSYSSLIKKFVKLLSFPIQFSFYHHIWGLKSSTWKDAWVAQSIKDLTLDLGSSSHSHEIEPYIRCCTGHAACLRLSLSLCPSPIHAPVLYLSKEFNTRFSTLLFTTQKSNTLPFII